MNKNRVINHKIVKLLEKALVIKDLTINNYKTRKRENNRSSKNCEVASP